jgi:hypothetical protein
MTTNEHTGDALRTKASTDKFRSGYDLIWGKKEPVTAPLLLEEEKDETDIDEATR